MLFQSEIEERDIWKFYSNVNYDGSDHHLQRLSGHRHFRLGKLSKPRKSFDLNASGIGVLAFIFLIEDFNVTCDISLRSNLPELSIDC